MANKSATVDTAFVTPEKNPMVALRWILFIPLGLLLGTLFSLPVQLFVRFGQFFWGSGWGDGAWIVFVKLFTLTYFQILCMAWIAPVTLKPADFKNFVSILFGIYLTVSFVGAISLLSGKPSVLDGNPVPAWEVWTESIASIFGYITAIFWDGKSIPLLLKNTKGVHPYNSMTYEGGAFSE